MKAIHGGKSKNDRIDAGKIAGLFGRAAWSHRPLEVACALSLKRTGTMRPLRSRPGPA